MGKGRIITAQGEGLYTLELVEDRTRAESQRARAVAKIGEIDSRITDLEQDEADAQQVVETAADEQDAAIEQYRLDMEQDGESDIKLADYAEALQEAASKRDAIRAQIRLLGVQKLAAQSRIDRIDTLPPLRQIDAWCADYTEDLSGEVATAEVPGEVGQVIIRPGSSDGAAWSASEDGAMQPALSGTPASVFYNLAMMPGWQKWRPTFRIATISNIDNDLCDITLDAATSSQQGLNVNAQDSYTGVPIAYMDCNGGAFEDGDRVLVAFSGNTDKPMVVGFESSPKNCYLYVAIPLVLMLEEHIVDVGVAEKCFSENPVPTSSLTDSAVRRYRYAYPLARSRGRIYPHLSSSVYGSAAHIDDLGEYTASAWNDYGTDFKSEMFGGIKNPDYVYYVDTEYGGGPCEIGLHAHSVWITPMTRSELLGMDVDVQTSATDISLDIGVKASSTYEFHQHDASGNGLRWYTGRSASVAETHSYQNDITDIPSLVYSGREYHPVEIVGALDGDLAVDEGASYGDDWFDFSGTKWVLVRYA